MPIRTCKLCGQEFVAKTSRRDYCAGVCYRANERARQAERTAKFSPERRRAMVLVQSAISHGTLVKSRCEVCGRLNAVAHHDDYAKPLDVRWLCRSDHKKHHDEFGPGRNA